MTLASIINFNKTKNKLKLRKLQVSKLLVNSAKKLLFYENVKTISSESVNFFIKFMIAGTRQTKQFPIEMYSIFKPNKKGY